MGFFKKRATLSFCFPSCWCQGRFPLVHPPLSATDYWFSEVASSNALEPSPTTRHRKVKAISLWSRKNLTLKYHEHESESCNKLKNCLTQFSRWQITIGHFLARYAIFVRHCFLCVTYLSISGGVFVICHFGKVSLFSNGIKECQ